MIHLGRCLVAIIKVPTVANKTTEATTRKVGETKIWIGIVEEEVDCPEMVEETD